MEKPERINLKKRNLQKQEEFIAEYFEKGGKKKAAAETLKDQQVAGFRFLCEDLFHFGCETASIHRPILYHGSENPFAG